jgi:hypothetical protein
VTQPGPSRLETSRNSLIEHTFVGTEMTAHQNYPRVVTWMAFYAAGGAPATPKGQAEPQNAASSSD